MTKEFQSLKNFCITTLDGTDYWLGGLDANKDKQLQWMTGII